MNLSLPMSVKGAAKAIGVFILLGVAAAAASAALAAGADAAGLSSISAMIRKFSPFRFA